MHFDTLMVPIYDMLDNHRCRAFALHVFSAHNPDRFLDQDLPTLEHLTPASLPRVFLHSIFLVFSLLF